MGKKIEKFIMDDFNETYKVDIDTSKIMNNIQMDNDNDFDVKENTNITLLKLKSLCKKLTISISVLVICLIGVIGISVIGNFKISKDDEILTQEFKDYMAEYSNAKKCKLYSFITNNGVKLSIYEVVNKENNTNYYFYKVKSEEDIENCILKINNNNIQLLNNSYGLLCEISSDQEITFSIEKNGVITDYKIK